MKANIDPRLIGTNCIVKDPYYGTYKGVIKGSHKCYSDVPRVKCPDTRMLITTKPGGYFNKKLRVNRKPYPPGSTQHFAITEVTPMLEVTT